MEPLVVLLIGVLIAIVVMPFVALFKAIAARRIADELQQRIQSLEIELRSLRRQGAAEAKPEPALTASPLAETSRPEPAPPAVPQPAIVAPSPMPPPVPVRQEPAKAATPAPVPAIPPRPAKPAKPPVNWEQFMGAKLFAWIGGLALFLGIAFFVKYSFERNLIPPEMRVAIGFLAGLGLLIGGVLLKKKENVVTAQTLCATGVLVLYAVTFACRSFYHFAFFGPVPTFLLMTLITAVAFLVAVRLNALVVAILGIAGGFLTPVLLSTGQDNPAGLFIYIALLDIGLLTVAQRQRWNVLPILGAAGTVLMQAGWVGKFFVTEKYFAGNKILIAMAVFAGFEALFLAAAAVAKRAEKLNRTLSASALAVSVAAMVSAFYFLSFQTLAHRPALLFSYVFLIDVGLLALTLLNPKLVAVEAAGGVAAFVFLGGWTGAYLTTAFLQRALAFYFVFALLHSAAPLVLQRLRKISLPWWSHAFPALALVLVLMPIFKLTELSILVWPFVLFVDVLALVLAAITATLLPILVVLVLTLVAMGAWLFRIPSELTGLPTALFLLGGFAVFFLVAATWACRRLMSSTETTPGRAPTLFGSLTDPANLSVQLPALSATLPFLLLIMATLRLPLANPSPVFGLALLLVVLLLGMTKILSLDVLPAVGLASVLGLEHAWHLHRFDPAHASVPLAWYLVFFAVFTVFPFLFHRRFAEKTLPWATAALAGPLHFYLLFDVMRSAWPNAVPGLLPAALAVPSLLGLVLLLKRTPAASAARNAQLALFGGAALFFITLIFPIQFDRQWITVAWALEGAALCWLFQRVPHPGLRIVGVGLLIVAFARLALNPSVLDYHPRAATPVWNWYLYAYGVVALCQFAAARLLAPPRDKVIGFSVLPLLGTLGTILAFLLVNIEIADYFSTPGTAALTFQFSGNFARDMSYSIAWALFALLLLLFGIRKRIAPVRYASLALLGVTVLKLFLHDLSQLDQLYRIAAFVVVAIIAMLASFLYQRFLATTEKTHETESTPPSA